MISKPQKHFVFSILSFWIAGLATSQSFAQNSPVPAAPAVTPSTSAPAVPTPKNRGIPLKFDMIGDGVTLAPLHLQYDMSQGSTLKMGGQTLGLNTFYAEVISGHELDATAVKGGSSVLTAPEKLKNYFLVQWPEPLNSQGQLEIISRSGKTIWSLSLDTPEMKTWRRFGRTLSNRTKNKLIDKYKQATLLWPTDGNPILDVLGDQAETFKICITRYEGSRYTRLCTAPYETIDKGNGLVKIQMAGRALRTPRTIALGENAALTMDQEVKPGQPIQFFAELNNGITYEFLAQPEVPSIMDFVLNPITNDVEVVGFGNRPTDRFVEINKEEESQWVDFLKWQKTIGDFRQFWRSYFPRSASLMHFTGIGGGTFVQSFVITKMPTEKDRIYIAKDTILGTYVNGPKVFGQRDKSLKLSSTQNSVVSEPDELDFKWYFKAENRGEINKSYLNVNDGKNSFRSYTEMYKGYPREFSLRSSGIISSEGKTVLVGEVAFQYWFEDLFSWTQYYLARQRWGVSVKYFESLGHFSIGHASSTLSIQTVDLKYRLTPGLWNRDETWGAVLGAQHLKYSFFDESIFGAGVFWARSLPKLFDDVVNYFWLDGYPKWVDAQFVSYLGSPTSTTRVLVPTYTLDFHGKIMWTNWFFGEAGFGIKQYDVNDLKTTVRSNLKFGSLYATVGLGVNF